MEKKPEEQKAEELPFPNSRVVDLIRSKTGKAVIKKKVKTAMNQLLADICLRISEKMAGTHYATINYEDFQKAARPYLKLGLSQQEQKKIIATLDKISEDAKTMSMELKEETEKD